MATSIGVLYIFIFAIVYVSWDHYLDPALNTLYIYIFIYLTGSHLAAITNASNCNQPPLGDRLP